MFNIRISFIHHSFLCHSIPPSFPPFLLLFFSFLQFLFASERKLFFNDCLCAFQFLDTLFLRMFLVGLRPTKT